MEKKILVKKDFLDKVLQQQTDMKERIAELEKIKEPQGLKFVISDPDKNSGKSSYKNSQQDPRGFLFTCSSRYLGGKDLEKEKLFESEIKTIMIKYKILNCVADLAKLF
jgi:hypothetical protein